MPVFPGFHHILQYCTLYCTAPVCRWTRKPGPWLMQRILSETFAKKYYIIFSKLEKATHLAWRRGAAASGNSVRLGRPSAESRLTSQPQSHRVCRRPLASLGRRGQNRAASRRQRSRFPGPSPRKSSGRDHNTPGPLSITACFALRFRLESQSPRQVRGTSNFKLKP